MALKYLFIFLIASTLAFVARPNSNPDLTVVGYIDLIDGIGRQGAELVQAFKKELNLNIRLTRPFRNENDKNQYKNLVAKSDYQWGKVVVFEEMLSIPWGVSDQTGIIDSCPQDRIKIAYSMWESTQIPLRWADILNEKFDAVFVPSRFLVEVYQKNGVRIPIFVVPLALEFEHFFRQPLKQNIQEIITFGNFSGGWERKNQLKLIEAFHQAFGNDPKAKLIINSRSADKEIRKEITKKIAELESCNIQYMQIPRDKDDYLKLFSKIDCYVSPSKGEGFSIQPREAMALGIPVIATNNTGQIEICQSQLVREVPSTVLVPAYYPGGKAFGKNFDCSVDDLAAALLDIRANYSFYLANAEKARAWASQYLYGNLKPLYAAFISPKELILGDENEITKSYLKTNSVELFSKYQAIFSKKEKGITRFFKQDETRVEEMLVENLQFSL